MPALNNNPPEHGARWNNRCCTVQTNGVILGRFWSEADPPPAGVKYQKELIPGITESVQEAEYKLTAPGITFQSGAASITVAELIELRSKVKELEEKI